MLILNSVPTEKPIDTVNTKIDSIIKHLSSKPPPVQPIPVEQSIYSDQDIGNIIKKNKELELKIRKLEKLYLEQN